MIKTLKDKIKDDGYIAANKDWLDTMVESAFHDLRLPDNVTKKMVTDAFYKDMTRIALYKDYSPTCIMFKDSWFGSDCPIRALGNGIAFIHEFVDADYFRDLCVSSVTAYHRPYFDRGICNVIRTIVAGRNVPHVYEDEYIRYALPMPLSRIDGSFYDLKPDVELIAFEHKGCVQIAIPHIDTQADVGNVCHIVGSQASVRFFKVLYGSYREWKLQELSKVLSDHCCNALLVRFDTTDEGVYDPAYKPDND